jgi:purine nucleoside phosphorylase
MSTAAETTIAAHAGVPCLGMSLLTNVAIDPEDTETQPPNHEEVKQECDKVSKQLEVLVEAFLAALNTDDMPISKAGKYFIANVKPLEASA